MSGITDPAEAYFKDGIWGWDGAVWRKLPLVWGFSEIYSERESADNVAAGNQTLTFSTVPAGEIWRIHAFNGWCTTTNPARILLYAVCGGVAVELTVRAYTVARDTVDLLTPVVLREGDYLYAIFATCSLNDDIRANACGYKMKVAE